MTLLSKKRNQDAFNQVSRIVPVEEHGIVMPHEAQVARFQVYVQNYGLWLKAANSLHEPLVNTVTDLLDIRTDDSPTLGKETIVILKSLVCVTLWRDEWIEWFNEKQSKNSTCLDFGNFLKQASFVF